MILWMDLSHTMNLLSEELRRISLMSSIHDPSSKAGWFFLFLKDVRIQIVCHWQQEELSSVSALILLLTGLFPACTHASRSSSWRRVIEATVKMMLLHKIDLTVFKC